MTILRSVAQKLRCSTNTIRCIRYVSSYADKVEQFSKEIDALPEIRAQKMLSVFLDNMVDEIQHSQEILPPIPPKEGYKYLMSQEEIIRTVDAAIITFCLHVEARIASLIGEGFYTIGPCGEEALSSIANALRMEDSMALHYRHLGVSIARQLRRGQSVHDIILDRARGYTVSSLDPVTGGVHCSIGSQDKHDFVVTSTLASQCPPAVGRALAYSVIDDNPGERPVSFVTLGDGSVHNHHFWSAFHLSRHARHRGIKCPVVFGISDNGLSISYSTGGYVDTLFNNDPLVPLFKANGNDMMDVYSKSKQALEYSRKVSAPSVVIYSSLVRRFGHAATDRQFAYLTEAEIQSMADSQLLESAIIQAVEVYGALTYAEVRDRYDETKDIIRKAFEEASTEPKVSRQGMIEQNSAPPVYVKGTAASSQGVLSASKGEGRKEVMRKRMTSVIDEVLSDDPKTIYLGEDVEHGGYYLVTENLADKYPGRVCDFPPDETSLMGAAMGFSQMGLVPIVEIPYAKYLDCAADMMNEIAIMHWLSKQNNGMVIRLQGFDVGRFGGNFHTHNALSHIPVGVDVVCYSNGFDYVRGFRNLVAQARAGRVVMTVDSTNLLNLRHLHGKDRGWECAYPDRDTNDSVLDFDTVIEYGSKGSTVIVSYGNGVVTSLQARKQLFESGIIQSEDDISVVDCPLLSDVPKGLTNAIQRFDRIVFADVVKSGPGSSVLPSMAMKLQSEGLLRGKQWAYTSAPRTYNPLGSLETFLSTDDIIEAYKSLE